MRLRNALRCRRIASAFSRARRSDGFSYARRFFISRKVPSRCIFFLRMRSAALTSLSRTKTCIRGSCVGNGTCRRASAAAVEAAMLAGGLGAAGILLAEADPSLGEIVGRHLDGDAVAGEDADAVLLHAARAVGERLVPVVEPHLEARVRQLLQHDAAELDQILFRHVIT